MKLVEHRRATSPIGRTEDDDRPDRPERSSPDGFSRSALPQDGGHIHDGPGRFRLRGRVRKVVLTVHILASVGWFGIAVLVAFCGIAAAAATDPMLTQALYRTMQTAPWLSIPMGIAAVGTGVILGVGTTYGLVRHWWVVAKMVIAAAVIITDAVLVSRVAHEAVVRGQASPPVYGSTIAHVAVLAIATVLSVFKPGGRTPWGRHVTASSPGGALQPGRP